MPRFHDSSSSRYPYLSTGQPHESMLRDIMLTIVSDRIYVRIYYQHLSHRRKGRFELQCRANQRDSYHGRWALVDNYISQTEKARQSPSVRAWAKAVDMLNSYIIYYKYQNPGDKKPGPVRQFRVYANSFDEARTLANKQGNYPNMEVLRVTAV